MHIDVQSTNPRPHTFTQKRVPIVQPVSNTDGSSCSKRSITTFSKRPKSKTEQGRTSTFREFSIVRGVGEVCILSGVKKGRWSEAIAIGRLAFVERVKGDLGIKAMHREVLETENLDLEPGQLTGQMIQRI